MRKEKKFDCVQMKNNIQAFFTLISLIISAQAAASSTASDQSIIQSEQEIIRTHNKITSVSLRMQLDDSLHGTVESKVCSFCKTIRITVTPSTIAYRNNVKVPLLEAKNRIGRHATVIYDLKTKHVSAIRW